MTLNPLSCLGRPAVGRCFRGWLAAVWLGGAGLTLRAELRLAAVFPAKAATEVCPDTPLRLTFPTMPSAGTGTVKIVETLTGRVVDTIDVGSLISKRTIGGLDGYNTYTVLVDGNEVTLSPQPGALVYGKTYSVTIDAGAFKSGAETSAVVASADGWIFSTKAAPPPVNRARLVVAADGTGDFCTVQGALDFVPDGNTAPVTLFLRKGTYREIVFFTNKHAITLLGEDRKQTVIAYANNANFNASGGNPFANRADPSTQNPRQGGSVYRRGMFLAHRVNDLRLENLTLRNTTPQGGSQAEALILNGTTEARAVIKDVDFYSFQDTVQINGQAYIGNCFIEGDVDFMWGTGPSFFEGCTLRTVRSGAYYTQVRNPATNHGFVYLRCVFEGAAGVTDNYLSRIEPHRFPHSEVVLVDCVLGTSVHPAGWMLQAAPKDAPAPDLTHLRFWEFNSRTPDGIAVDASKRLGSSRQLQFPDDAAAVRDYRDPVFVLGHGWNPRGASNGAR